MRAKQDSQISGRIYKKINLYIIFDHTDVQACLKQKKILKKDEDLRTNSVGHLEPSSSKILISVSLNYKRLKVEQIV